MKYYEDHFDEYLTANKRMNLHPSLHKVYCKFPKNKMCNAIFYGPGGVGKYTQMLLAIKKYSPTELKYEKRMSITFNNEPVYIKMSDIHFEINMALLGCNSKLLWNEIYTQIIDVISMRPLMNGIIVCKNFHGIHGELLDVFYSYIRCSNPRIMVSFVLLTDHIGFIPTNIIGCCEIVHVKRPSVAMYRKCLATFGPPANASNASKRDSFRLTPAIVRTITNIKSIRSQCANNINPLAITPVHTAICNTILNSILNPDAMVLLNFRDALYDILICDIDIYNCVWFIVNGVMVHLAETSDAPLPPRLVTDIMNNTYSFLHLYNNNYRPIYHLERFMFMLINHTRDQKGTSKKNSTAEDGNNSTVAVDNKN
jgi:hypothetical protein